MVALTAPPAVLMGHAATAATHGLLAAVAGTLLLSSGCSAVNAWYERDRDALMSRTARRPLPAGDLAAGEALTFGLVTAVLGILVLAAWGSALGALLGALTFAYYLGIYTVWLKPRSAHSTVAGAVAGAAAPLIADAAAHGRIGPWGWTVFAIIFLWQPAHVWAIALFRKNEFAAAGLPMMPAIVGETATRRLMLGWTLPLLPVSLLPWLGGVLGPVYAVTALAVGAMFVATIAQAMRARDARSDRRVFKVSLIYLMAVFGAMLAELALR
jgi:protoheme IX farnesyltransferase